MSRRVAILAVFAALLTAGSARAAVDPALMSHLAPRHLLAEVGKPVRPKPVFDSGFTVAASHGYKIKVFSFGSAVILEAMHRDHRHLSAAVYLARGVATPQRLQATFGNLGKVSMRFRPPKASGRSSVCRFGERLVRRRGAYVGRLDFTGEGGYVAVRLHRAKGKIVTPAGRCPRRHLTHAQEEKRLGSLFEPISGLLASSREGVTTTTLFGIKRKSGSAFFVSHEETHGRLAIIRLVIAEGRKGFHANEAATAVTLSPPAPFHGSGHYRAEPDGTTTWTGPLSVNFPGAPRSPLTGPSFETFIEIPF